MDDFGSTPSADPEPEQPKEDKWGMWGTSSKDKKKKGKAANPGLVLSPSSHIGRPRTGGKGRRSLGHSREEGQEE